MLTWPDLRDEYQPGKLATTETRQAFTRGSFRVTLAFGASAPERVTTFAPTRTATDVAVMARPFTTVRVVAARAASRVPTGPRVEAAAGAAAAGTEVVAGLAGSDVAGTAATGLALS